MSSTARSASRNFFPGRGSQILGDAPKPCSLYSFRRTVSEIHRYQSQEEPTLSYPFALGSAAVSESQRYFGERSYGPEIRGSIAAIPAKRPQRFSALPPSRAQLGNEARLS